jgi:hypothetical protein
LLNGAAAGEPYTTSDQAAPQSGRNVALLQQIVDAFRTAA